MINFNDNGGKEVGQILKNGIKKLPVEAYDCIWSQADF